jgi:alkylation response protein AidB-like acyl-CoA dehydrogenase
VSATAVLDAVLGHFAGSARGVDRPDGDVRPGLRLLGERGLLNLELPAMAALVEDIAGECLSSAFSLWAHRMVIEYSAWSPAAEVRDALVRASVIGSTAMAPALRDVAGIEPVPVVAERTRGGLRLNGPIRWASNLFPAAVVVVPARLDDGSRVVVLMSIDQEGVDRAPSPELLALNATASSSVKLRDVEIPAEAVLSEDLQGFVAAIRPSFLLLQSAFCTGLARRSVTEAESLLDGLNAEFREDVEQAVQRLATVRGRLHELVREPERASRQELLRTRLDASRIAVDATRLEAAVRGGAGFVAGSGTARRLREAAFLPIQSPTEGQLRWELSHCG